MASFRKKGEFWYYRFVDENGKQVERKGHRDKATTKAMARGAEDEAGKVRAGLFVRPEAEGKTMGELLDSYIEELKVKERSENYIRYSRYNVERVVALAGIKKPSDWTDGKRVLKALAAIRSEGAAAASVNTVQTSCKAFARWLGHPIQGIKGHRLNAEADRRRGARVLTEEESRVLLTQLEGERCNIPALKRRWVYALAMATGLRRKELNALTPESFHLEGEVPYVVVPAGLTKNGKEAKLPLSTGMAEALVGFLDGKAGDKPLFKLPWHTADMLRDDLKSVGIDPKGVEFHGLRAAYITRLCLGNTPLAVVQKLARHSTINLTIKAYARLSDDAGVEAINGLPNLFP